MKQPNNYLENEFKKKICEHIVLGIPFDSIMCAVWHTEFCFKCDSQKGGKCRYFVNFHCNHPELLPILETTRALYGKNL